MRLGISFPTILMLTFLLQSSVSGQGPVKWDWPDNLSSSVTGSAHPAIAADAYGNVHVIWSENTAGGDYSPESAATGNTLLYSRFDGNSWTIPLDIFYMADDGAADYPRLVIDKNQQLHLVWTGVHRIYYSQAPASKAYAASAWQVPVVISENSARSRFESSVAVDGQGDIHVVYAGSDDEEGVFYRRSRDGGRHFESPVLLSAPRRACESSYSTVQVAVGLSDVVHVVWETADDTGFGRGVYYRRSKDQGTTWQAPVSIIFTNQDHAFVGWPSLFVSGQGVLHLIYALEDNVARGHRMSYDSGESWEVEEIILSEMEGINGFVFPLEDAGDNLHLIINMRPTATQETGLYHAVLSEQRWFPVTPIALGEPFGPSAHYASGTVRLGNELHVVWTDLGTGEIWHIRGLVSGVTAVPPIPVANETVEAMETSEPPATPGAEQQQPAASAGLSLNQTPGQGNAFSHAPLFASVGATVLIIIPVFLWRRARH